MNLQSLTTHRSLKMFFSRLALQFDDHESNFNFLNSNVLRFDINCLIDIL